jgi:aminopeptidase-like protein
LLPGERDDEVLLTTHVCHPSLANDNLSGIALLTELGARLQDVPRSLSYRLLFIPGTIGSITWLARNEHNTHRIKHGLVVTCVGDLGDPTYKRSRRANAQIDRAAEHVLRTSGSPYKILDFSPYGYDERQYCSPGFDLAVGSLMRTPNGDYPEYHTSGDNLDFVSAQSLADSLLNYLSVLDVLENNDTFLNLNPKGEPQLGRRGLYPLMGAAGVGDELLARLWVLNLSDGEHSLLDIAERSGLSFPLIREAARTLLEGKLLKLLPQGMNRSPRQTR